MSLALQSIAPVLQLFLMIFEVVYNIKQFVAVNMLLGNTRVITQSALQQFQEEIGKALKDPYKVCNYVTLSVSEGCSAV